MFPFVVCRLRLESQTPVSEQQPQAVINKINWDYISDNNEKKDINLFSLR